MDEMHKDSGYQAPTVTELGSVEDMTLANTNGPNLDATFQPGLRQPLLPSRSRQRDVSAALVVVDAAR